MTETVDLSTLRATAGRKGAARMHELQQLGLEYERERGLKAGRQRQKQLIQLGRRLERERGVNQPPKRRKRRKPTEAWADFLTALTYLVKAAHRPQVERLVAALTKGPD